MRREIIDKIKATSMEVYMRNETDNYCLFTLGNNIGYLQENRWGIMMSTRHKPTQSNGNGFCVRDGVHDFTCTDLIECFAMVPPGFGTSPKDITKWRDIEEYRSSNTFNAEFKLVE